MPGGVAELHATHFNLAACSKTGAFSKRIVLLNLKLIFDQFREVAASAIHAVGQKGTPLLHHCQTKRNIALIFFMMVACLVGRNFVANATFYSVKAKPRACAISHNQIDVCKEINKKQGAQHPVAVTVPALQVPPPVAVFTYKVNLALFVYDDEEISTTFPPRAPPLLS